MTHITKMKRMYISKSDLELFGQLYRSLDKKQRKKFLSILLKAIGKKSNQISKIHVCESPDRRRIDPRDLITRVVIRAAFDAVKSKE